MQITSLRRLTWSWSSAKCASQSGSSVTSMDHRLQCFKMAVSLHPLPGHRAGCAALLLCARARDQDGRHARAHQPYQRLHPVRGRLPRPVLRAPRHAARPHAHRRRGRLSGDFSCADFPRTSCQVDARSGRVLRELAEWTAVFGLNLEDATAKHWAILAPMHTWHFTSTLIWYGTDLSEFLFVLSRLTLAFRSPRSKRTPRFGSS